VKRTIAAVVMVTLAGVAVALAYQAAARQADYRAYIARGDTALRDDQTFAAIEAYSGAIALRADSMLAHLRLGETYQRRGNLDEAARELRIASGLDPAATRPLEELGDVSYQQQQYARAVEAYVHATHVDERSARVSYKLALAQYRAGTLDAALQTARQSLALDPRSSDALYLLGLCLRDKRQTADALRAFEQAAAIAPGSIPAREELADLYRLLDRKNDEIEQLQLLAGLDRSHVERQEALGLAHHRAGHGDLAVLTLGDALERWPDDPGIYRALGRVWLDRARDDRALLKKAREALDRIAASPAATSETLTLYARARLQEGEVEEADRVLQQAMNRYPVDPEAFALYATIASSLGNVEAARRAQTEYEALTSK
jgi:tetratricopeptide (TPR) repeat protein